MCSLHMDEIRDTSCAEASHSDQKNRFQLLQKFVSACNKPDTGPPKQHDNPVANALCSERDDSSASGDHELSSGARIDSFLLASSLRGFHGRLHKISCNESEIQRRSFSTSPPKSRSRIIRKELSISNEHAVYKTQVARTLSGGSAVWL